MSLKKNLLNNDGLLISEYSSINAIEYSKSQSEIEEFVLDLKSKLNSKQSVHIERVGKLSYDLEGNLVFEQKGTYTPWDGTYNTKELPAGTYYYIINLNYLDRAPVTGTINIIK